MIRHLIAALCASALISQLCMAESDQRTLIQDVRLEQHLNTQIDLNLEFLDEEGRRVTLGHFVKDKPVILTCVYYRCPMLCTEVLNGVLKSANAMSLRLGED